MGWKVGGDRGKAVRSKDKAVNTGSYRRKLDKVAKKYKNIIITNFLVCIIEIQDPK